MEKIINLLKELKIKAEKEFIDSSIIKREITSGAVPDTEACLDDIADLKTAIEVLENYEPPATTSNNNCTFCKHYVKFRGNQFFRGLNYCTKSVDLSQGIEYGCKYFEEELDK